MLEAILQGILEGRFPLRSHAESVFGLRTQRLEAQEYLTRYLNEQGEPCSVGAFFGDHTLKFEDRVALDLRCLDNTFAHLATLPSSTHHLHFVNLEPLTLESSLFWERLPRWLGDMNIRPDQVVLEFTEAHSVHDQNDLQHFSSRLRIAGLRVAVDDLGSGVASLSHMARLAPDFIKADRSLVNMAHRRPYQAALLNALAHFAKAMCIGFIAEGIETPEELQAVTDADVPWGQGFVFGERQPVAPSEAVG
jgi:EAL domain-containing protein (putative c-di-GMP-specific phosphodiesterase class I)